MEVIEFLSNTTLYFWATEQPEGFLTDMVVLALYKLINGGGYQKLLREITLPYPFNHKFYQHNCNIIWEKG
jgi:hypothetical protein